MADHSFLVLISDYKTICDLLNKECKQYLDSSNPAPQNLFDALDKLVYIKQIIPRLISCGCKTAIKQLETLIQELVSMEAVNAILLSGCQRDHELRSRYIAPVRIDYNPGSLLPQGSSFVDQASPKTRSPTKVTPMFDALSNTAIGAVDVALPSSSVTGLAPKGTYRCTEKYFDLTGHLGQSAVRRIAVIKHQQTLEPLSEPSSPRNLDHLFKYVKFVESGSDSDSSSDGSVCDPNQLLRSSNT